MKVSTCASFQFPNRNSGRSEARHRGAAAFQRVVSIPQSEFGSFRGAGRLCRSGMAAAGFQFPNRNSGRSEAPNVVQPCCRWEVSIPQSEFGSFRVALAIIDVGDTAVFQFPNRNSGRSEARPLLCPGGHCRGFNSPIGIRVVQSQWLGDPPNVNNVFQFPNRNSGRSEAHLAGQVRQIVNVSIPQSEFGSFRESYIAPGQCRRVVSIPQSEFGSFRGARRRADRPYLTSFNSPIGIRVVQSGQGRSFRSQTTLFQFPNRNSGRSEETICTPAAHLTTFQFPNRRVGPGPTPITFERNHRVTTQFRTPTKA